ncbi:RNA repair transcriptional activator RtcR [Leucothrix mucor]|uniref:RNA repair transcriptional activator RtcR n=1 Tax=Leucothrix mucor TaxID=45248 RepID=UPI0003B3305C|nr:RNA repair transcriptional activator RtcR [Leucothrix mucor]
MTSNVIISILGSKLDHRGFGQKRFERWRPNVALAQHPELPIDEFILLYHPDHEALAKLTLGDIKEVSPSTKLTGITLNIDDPWNFEQVYGELHDVMKRISFDPENHNYYTHITTGTHVAQICLYLLTEARFIPGKLLQSSPLKEGNGGSYQIIDLDLSCYDQIASRFAAEARQGVDHLKGGIQTRNAAFNKMMAQLEQVSIRSTAPILLTGPTGAGKSQLARRIYALKQKRGLVSADLVEVNCATLRGDNAMSALFGHVKGAFTGALNARTGLLREANKGLLFLDEIGELGLDEQAMLLRAIEDKVFMPLGSDRNISSDFQLIAGTNRNLFQRVSEGLFREDLLARINLWTYEIPSLKARQEDLDPNIDYELQQFTHKAGHNVRFNKTARKQYLDFAHSGEASWRANFRDLNSSMTRMATLASGGRITEAIIADEIVRLQSDWANHETKASGSTSVADTLQSILSDAAIAEIDLFDHAQLAHVIEICRGSKSMAEAGRKLFNVSRERRSSSNDSNRLKVYLNKFDLEFKQLTAN